MSQVENKGREIPKNQEDQSIEDWEEASYTHTLYGFEEVLKSKRWGSKVWKDLDTETKAIIRTIVAVEQLYSERKIKE